MTFSAIALNEVIKYKAREKEKDDILDEDNKDLLDNVDRLDKIIDRQICDINKLQNIVNIYNKELAK